MYFRHAAWVYVDDFLVLFPNSTAGWAPFCAAHGSIPCAFRGLRGSPRIHPFNLLSQSFFSGSSVHLSKSLTFTSHEVRPFWRRNLAPVRGHTIAILISHLQSLKRSQRGNTLEKWWQRQTIYFAKGSCIPIRKRRMQIAERLLAFCCQEFLDRIWACESQSPS